jgi:predicted nucleic acid-binding protein
VILVDTSVWATHIQREVPALSELLDAEKVLVHPFVIGELAMGNLRARQAWLYDLQKLPFASLADDHDVLALVEHRRLFGRGIGYIDAHLLAATLLSPGASLWSLDQRLSAAAMQMKIASPL